MRGLTSLFGRRLAEDGVQGAAQVGAEYLVRRDDDSKSATESKNGTANGHRNSAANAELVDAEKASDEQQLPLDEMTEDGDETDSDD